MLAWHNFLPALKNPKPSPTDICSSWLGKTQCSWSPLTKEFQMRCILDNFACLFSSTVNLVFMTPATPKFTRDQLVNYLELLNRELEKMGVTGEICIVGGAAMVLGFGNRGSTRDIDALLISPASIRAAIQRVAAQENLSPSWLNDGAKGFASSQPVEFRQLMKMSCLRIISPPAEYILAMKCIAARVGIDENDKADARFLIQRLKLQDAAAVLAVAAKYYDAKRIPAKTQYFIQEICDELARPPQDIE
jgi:hypothetical protein